MELIRLTSLECTNLSVFTSYELKHSVNLARSINIRKLAVCYNQYKQHNTEKNVFLLFSCLFSSFFFPPSSIYSTVHTVHN